MTEVKLMDDPEASLRSFLTFLATEKSTAVSRMHTSFNWAFGILSVFTVGVVGRQDFQKRYLSWFMLSVALVLLTHFFVRTAKDYVHQIRFAGLQKHCLACLFSLSISGSAASLPALTKNADEDFIQRKTPKRLWPFLNKTPWEHVFYPFVSSITTFMALGGV